MLLAAYKREVRLFGNPVLKISGALGDDSRLASVFLSWSK
jgi:hypothetical protein